MNFPDIGTDLSLAGGIGQTGDVTRNGVIIMRAVTGRIDEFGFVDDPVKLLMLADELQKRRKADAFPLQPVWGGGYNRADGVSHLRRHIVHQCLKQRILRVEIGVEAAQRDARALRNAHYRTLVKPLFAKFRCRCVEQQAQGFAAAFGAWGFGGRCHCCRYATFWQIYPLPQLVS